MRAAIGAVADANPFRCGWRTSGSGLAVTADGPITHFAVFVHIDPVLLCAWCGSTTLTESGRGLGGMTTTAIVGAMAVLVKAASV